MKRLLVAVALAAAAAAAATAAWAGADTFDTARYDIGIKKNDEALAIVDSGQFDINTQTEEGYTLLHYAADAGNLDMVKALLLRGADPTIKAGTGSTPYNMASGTVVKAELARAAASWTGGAAKAADAAASVARPAPVASMAAPQPAAASGKAGGNGMCAAVLAEKVNDGRTPQLRPWLRARDDIWYSRPDELALLLEDCVDPNFQDETKYTLLMIAADRDKLPAGQVLLAHGANCSLTNDRGETALGLAHSPDMKALLANCPSAKAAAPATLPALAASADRKKECQSKFQADAALCSDSSCRMSANRKWQQCLKTGNYW